MDQSFSGDETNRDYHYGYLDVLWFRVLDSSDVNIPARQSLAQLRLSTVSPTRHHTKFTKTRKSKICSAEVVRVPRPTRNPRKHEKRKISWLLTHIVPSPVPFANFQFAQLRSDAFSVQPAHTKPTYSQTFGLVASLSTCSAKGPKGPRLS